MSSAAHPHGHEASIVETLQSLIVAFVLAMTFRGFITEGFVIPTGSMAPTLMGRHALLRSDQTGAVYPAGLDARGVAPGTFLFDPMLGRRVPLGAVRGRPPASRMGDRILVLKTIYPFAEPDRFDVVVFKNPTDPNGESENYIKRLIGLPDEKIWLADGDVFAAAGARSGSEGFAVQRKPEHVQRAVWQPLYHSDYVPLRPELLKYYEGCPWTPDPDEWDDSDPRVLRSLDDGLLTLDWAIGDRPLDDWTAYNMFAPISQASFEYVSDVRVGAAVTAAQAGLRTTFELEARRHVFQFIVEESRATVRMRPDFDPDAEWVSASAVIELPAPGRVFDVEFWHVDQALAIHLDGERVVELKYDWSPEDRLRYATGVLYPDEDEHLTAAPQPPQLRWRFQGSQVTLQRLRLDRDLHYRTGELSGSALRNPTQPGFEDVVQRGTPAFGTHPDRPARLGPDQFFMLGDNSMASLDSRLWGNPHPLIAEQIDPAPFVVSRQLLVGKAWVVYFPSPHTLRAGGRHVIPDFGRLRFIR